MPLLSKEGGSVCRVAQSAFAGGKSENQPTAAHHSKPATIARWSDAAAARAEQVHQGSLSLRVAQ